MLLVRIWVPFVATVVVLGLLCTTIVTARVAFTASSAGVTRLVAVALVIAASAVFVCCVPVGASARIQTGIAAAASIVTLADTAIRRRRMC